MVPKDTTNWAVGVVSASHPTITKITLSQYSEVQFGDHPFEISKWVSQIERTDNPCQIPPNPSNSDSAVKVAFSSVCGTQESSRKSGSQIA